MTLKLSCVPLERSTFVPFASSIVLFDPELLAVRPGRPLTAPAVAPAAAPAPCAVVLSAAPAVLVTRTGALATVEAAPDTVFETRAV